MIGQLICLWVIAEKKAWCLELDSRNAFGSGIAVQEIPRDGIPQFFITLGRPVHGSHACLAQCLVLINYRLVFLIAKRFKMQQRTCQCNTVQGVVSSRECEASTNNPEYVCLESLELEKQFFKVDILYLWEPTARTGLYNKNYYF